MPPRRPQERPRAPKTPSGQLQDGLRSSQDAPKMAPRAPKTPPRWPQERPEKPEMGPKDSKKGVQNGQQDRREVPGPEEHRGGVRPFADCDREEAHRLGRADGSARRRTRAAAGSTATWRRCRPSPGRPRRSTSAKVAALPASCPLGVSTKRPTNQHVALVKALPRLNNAPLGV